MLDMIDNSGDWCFEGGCTYLTNSDISVAKEEDSDALALYDEHCAASFD